MFTRSTDAIAHPLALSAPSGRASALPQRRRELGLVDWLLTVFLAPPDIVFVRSRKLVGHLWSEDAVVVNPAAMQVLLISVVLGGRHHLIGHNKAVAQVIVQSDQRPAQYPRQLSLQLLAQPLVPLRRGDGHGKRQQNHPTPDALVNALDLWFVVGRQQRLEHRLKGEEVPVLLGRR